MIHEKSALPALRTARQGVLKEKQMVFGVEYGKGIVRLNDTEIVEASVAGRKAICRKAKREMRKLAVVDYGKLSEDKKKEHVVASAQLGVIAMFAQKSAAKTIAKQMNNPSEALPIGQTLKMFVTN